MKEIVSFSKEIDFKGLVSKITKIALEHTLEVSEDNSINGDFIVSGTYKMTSVSSIDNNFSYKIPVSIEMDSSYDLKDVTIDIDNFTYEIIDDSILKVYIDILLDNLAKKEDMEVINSDDEIVTGDDLFLKEDEANKFEIPVLEPKEEPLCINDNLNEVREDNKDNNDCDDKIEELINFKDDEELNINKDEEGKIDNDYNTWNNKCADDKEDKKEEYMENEKENNENKYNNIENKEEKDEVKDKEKEEKIDTPSLFSSFDNTLDTYMSYSVHIVREGDSIETIITKYKTNKDLISEYNNLDNIKVGTKIIIPSNKNE